MDDLFELDLTSIYGDIIEGPELLAAAKNPCTSSSGYKIYWTDPKTGTKSCCNKTPTYDPVLGITNGAKCSLIPNGG